jgi:phospholipid N-methyltransferase
MSDHLTFYQTNEVSPVLQDVADAKKHLVRRESLYRSLGLPSTFFRDRTVLEVGPGSGQNSLHVASSMPSSLTLVEPNKSGVIQIEKSFGEWKFEHTKPLVVQETAQVFFESNLKRFDIVIAECWLGNTPQGKSVIRGLKNSLYTGGVVVLTSSPHIGLLANALRSLLGYRITSDPALGFQERVNRLLGAFRSHLDNLQGMSRFYEDWIIDVLLNPGALIEFISPVDLILILQDLDLLGTYPRISESWTWYKDFKSTDLNFDNQWIENYWRRSHNFLDTRTPIDSTCDSIANQQLDNFCKILIERVVTIRDHDQPDSQSLSILESVKELIPKQNKLVTDAFSEFLQVYSSQNISISDVSEMKMFGRWFGRELMYMSFIRQDLVI